MERRKKNEDNILFYDLYKAKQKEFTAATFLQFTVQKTQQGLQKEKGKKTTKFEHAFLKHNKNI